MAARRGGSSILHGLIYITEPETPAKKLTAAIACHLEFRGYVNVMQQNGCEEGLMPENATVFSHGMNGNKSM
jgi:hypothetical protein